MANFVPVKNNKINEKPYYTMEEISKHTTEDDLWIVIHNKVYNVTSYLNDHPGGSEILMENAGTDATESFEDIYHSKLARKKLSSLEIGNLSQSDPKLNQNLLDKKCQKEILYKKDQQFRANKRSNIYLRVNFKALLAIFL